MKVVTPISVFTGQVDRKKLDNCNVSIFLAGGISNCPDWQSFMIEILSQSFVSEYLTLYNPRRSHINLNDTNIAQQQIQWEYEHLKKSDIILFWFPKESVCPISLFECGRWTGDAGKTVFVGVDTDYVRKFDIEEQMKLVRPKMIVVDSLVELSEQVKRRSEKIILSRYSKSLIIS
jgi:hypothetical protein